MFSSCLILFEYLILLSFVYGFEIGLRDPSNVPEPFVNILQNSKDGKEVSLNWPKGIINYNVDEQAFSPKIQADIKHAMRIIELSSCIKFNPVSIQESKDKTWIRISNPNKERECNHEPRLQENGEIMLVLGYDCLTKKDLLHTLLHGVGLKDEVTHPHRDKYIRVQWNNIQPGYRHLYRKQLEEHAKNIVEYDPLSIMQFHDHAFSMNGRATIAPLEPGLLIHPSDSLSQLDRMRLQLNFGNECHKRKVYDILNSCKSNSDRNNFQVLSTKVYVDQLSASSEQNL